MAARRSSFTAGRKYPHQRFGYRRFATAADAVRFAIEELPPELLIGAILEVDGRDTAASKFIACTTATIFPFSCAPPAPMIARTRIYSS